MEIKYHQLCAALMAVAAETNWDAVASEVAQQCELLGLDAGKLVNKQNLYRWVYRDTAKSRLKIAAIRPAILSVLPSDTSARLLVGDSIAYRAARDLQHAGNRAMKAIAHAAIIGLYTKAGGGPSNSGLYH